MDDDNIFSPGWLRSEMITAIREIRERSYISKTLRRSLEGAANTILRSERLAGGDTEGQASSPPSSTNPFGNCGSCLTYTSARQGTHTSANDRREHDKEQSRERRHKNM